MMLENCHRDVEVALALLTRSSSGAAAHASSSSSAHPTASGPPRLGPPAASTSSTSRLQQHGVASSASSSNGGATDPTEDDDADARELKSVIESPLAVLAHISSLKVSESTEEESGKTFLPKGKQEQGAAAEGYFATGASSSRSRFLAVKASFDSCFVARRPVPAALGRRPGVRPGPARHHQRARVRAHRQLVRPPPPSLRPGLD